MNKTELLKSLKEKGFSDRIVKSFSKADRENFLPEEYKPFAYYDDALPIGYDQTISQPYTIAFMLKLLNIQNNQKILEVGSGSGYVLLLISFLGKNLNIFGIERIKELVEFSKQKLKKYKNIKIIYSQGERGLENEAPFDRILVSASCEKIPQELINQLKLGGVFVAPVKHSIYCVKKYLKKNNIKIFHGFTFVPLIINEKL